jgi:hypothetical protein
MTLMKIIIRDIIACCASSVNQVIQEIVLLGVQNQNQNKMSDVWTKTWIIKLNEFQSELDKLKYDKQQQNIKYQKYSLVHSISRTEDRPVLDAWSRVS